MRTSEAALDAVARVAPPCAHAGACGGCAFQDRALDGLATWKRAVVVDALARRGLTPEVAPTLACAPRSRRRARFAAMRGKKGARLGFLRAQSHEIVDVEACLLVTPALLAAAPALRTLAGFAAPRARRIGITVVETDSGLDVSLEAANALEAGKALELDVRERAAAWAAAAAVARLSWNGEPVAERRPPILRIGRATVAPPPGAFLQPTREGEAALQRLVADALGAPRRVADLFAGCGTFALRLAERSEVLAVEGDPALVAALDRAWRGADGLKRVVSAPRDLFRRPLRAEELKGVDAVVFDPPRQGAEAQARALADYRGETIVGVSCDADSFARDAAILAEGGWRLRRVAPVDQFLWSRHVELVGVFRRDE